MTFAEKLAKVWLKCMLGVAILVFVGVVALIIGMIVYANVSNWRGALPIDICFAVLALTTLSLYVLGEL